MQFPRFIEINYVLEFLFTVRTLIDKVGGQLLPVNSSGLPSRSPVGLSRESPEYDPSGRRIQIFRLLEGNVSWTNHKSNQLFMIDLFFRQP